MAGQRERIVVHLLCVVSLLGGFSFGAPPREPALSSMAAAVEMPAPVPAVETPDLPQSHGPSAPPAARIPAPSPPLPAAPIPPSPVPKVILPLPVLPFSDQERDEKLEPLLSAVPVVLSPASGKAGMPERPEPRDNPAPPSASVASAAPRFTLFLPLVTRNYDPTLISPRGGTFPSPDGRVIVTFPPGAVDRNVRVRYEALPAARPEGFAAGVGNFSFSATYSIQTVLWTQSYITYSSSAYYLTMKDVTPPQISGASIWPDGEGGYYLEVTVVDNCAVASVHLAAASSSGGGASAAMSRVSGDRYGAGIRLPRVGRNTFIIVATDAAGNSSIWTASLPSSYSGAFGFSCLKGPCGGHQGTEGDPVNTASGNFVTRTLDLRLPGIGNTEIRVERTYNAQAVPPQGDFTLIGMDPGPFGPGWSWPFDFHLEFVDNLLFQGVKVHYPDGHTARFRRNPDGSFSPVTPGNTDRFQAVPGGYILQQKDLTRYRFDPEGRLVEVQDPNGNTQTLTYNGAGQLVRVENSAGRWIELAYTPEGLIREITAPEGVRLQYAYTDGLLTAFTDARGQTWHYTYNSQGWLTAIISPKGRPILQLRYGENPDAPEYGRVIEQIEGATARRTFSYDDPSHTRTVRDAYGHPTVHQYDEDYRLIRLTDPLGDTEEYGYDDQDRRVSFRDKEGRQWRYVYDERGNLIREDGPLGWERAWEYNGMDRLTMEQDPAGRHTLYGYDDRGNLTVITNALGFTRTFTYDARGLPIRLTDFNGNVLTNTHDAAGNLIAVENGVGALTRYAYDGLGRTVAMTTPNGAVFTYTYRCYCLSSS